MGLPSISHWIDCVANPHGRFRTLGEFEAERDAHGDPKFTAGNNAAVFRIRQNDRRLMLKCYIKEGSHRDDVYDFTASSNEPLLTPARLLKEEAFIHDEPGVGSFHDIVVGEWVEGNTLETEIKRAAREFGASRFAELARLFTLAAGNIIECEWAHGDLKPENIVISEDGKAKLIDYDAMFVPALTGHRAFEVGTPPYQHPSRDESHFDRHIDDYPLAMICVSLNALALKPELYGKYHCGDNIIMYPDEILSGKSEAHEEVLELFASAGEFTLYNLARSLRSPLYRISDLARLFAKLADLQEPEPDETPLQLFGSGKSWGFQNATGETIIEPVFEEATEFSEGLAVVKINDKWIVIDTTGRIIIDGSEYDTVKPFGCGLAAFRKGRSWGYLDISGNVAIEPRYEMAGTMHEERAAVCLDGKFGYIDTHGNMVIKAKYERAQGFRNGMAIVYSGENIAHIDLSGNIV